MKVGGIDSSQIQAMLTQIRAASQSSAGVGGISGVNSLQGLGGVQPSSKVESSTKVDFSATLKAVLAQVNQSQVKADVLGQKFALGDNGVSLSEVIVAGQKASISLQATVQVRNKLVSAYHDIMAMQI